MDKYNLDSHKLMYHPEIVSKWKLGQHIYPLYVELSPSGICNYRCTFCALDFLGYKNNFLDVNAISEVCYNLGEVGTKAIMLGGEGEPLMHPYISIIIKAIKNSGIDIGITTNGSMLKKELAEEILQYCTWVKFSVNAGDEYTYKKIHGIKNGDFYNLVVIPNIADAVSYRNKMNLKCNIGVQAVVLKENIDSLNKLAERCSNIGVDYLVFKPYSQMRESQNMININYDLLIYELNTIKHDYEDKRFEIIVRTNALNKSSEKRNYANCQALPFWSYIRANGDVWNCSAKMSDERFKLGNIYTDSVSNIWNKDKNIKAVDAKDCRVNCRMDEVNRYLDRIINPMEHDNFI